MKVSIVQETADTLEEYARVPIAFTTGTVCDVTSSEAGRLELTERAIDIPLTKDYDSVNNGPTSWPSTFDISRWGFFAAYVNGDRAGGAVVAFGSDDVDMSEGRADLAVLWDLRVSPACRGIGIGSALIDAAEKWAAANGASTLKVETQNINVAACRRYARSGFVLRHANFGAYPDYPGEVQLLWYKDLTASEGQSATELAPQE